MAKKVKGQIIQFSFIGIANAAIDIGALNILLWIWPTSQRSLLLIFNTVAYGLAILNSYFWNKKYTFSHRASSGFKEAGLFFLQAALALGVNNLAFIGTYELLTYLSLPMADFILRNIAKGTAMFLSFSASFFMLKYVVFRSKKQARNR